MLGGEYKCKICGNVKDNAPYVVREMMFGLRSEFLYIKCSACGCLQINEVPVNMDEYYPPSYYSFQGTEAMGKRKSMKARLSYYLMKKSLRHQVGHTNLIGWLARMYKPEYYRDFYFWLNKDIAWPEARILDVGCGKGELLHLLLHCGFVHLSGCDPYLSEDICLSSEAMIYKKEIFELEGKYDLIMLHHSFEHMANPSQVLAKLRTLLAPGGTLLIRIPVVDCYAWRKYGVDWFEIDAPRHFFLHTVKSLNLLAKSARLTVADIKYDSLYHQLAISEKYLRNYTFTEDVSLFSKEEINAFKAFSRQLNMMHDGDRACFYLKSNTN